MTLQKKLKRQKRIGSMIRINKTANIPTVLAINGLAETKKLMRNFDKNPTKYTSRNGVPAKHIAKMDFDNTIYGHATVKEQLIVEQNDKCCFCEGKFSDNSFGD